jgi:hypothetical protein
MPPPATVTAVPQAAPGALPWGSPGPAPAGYMNPANGAPSSSPGSPGISGAILDAVSALAKAFAPQAMIHRKAIIDKQVAQGEGSDLGAQF